MQEHLLVAAQALSFFAGLEHNQNYFKVTYANINK